MINSMGCAQGCVWFENEEEWNVMVPIHQNGLVPFLSLFGDKMWNGMVIFQRLVGELEWNGF